jgi:hypothetical protein
MSTTGHLEPDYTTVPGQNFALLSWVGPEGPAQKSEKYGIKIRGCFATEEDARVHAKRLQKEDNLLDIFVVSMYQWLLCWPGPGDIENVEYQNEKLNEMVQERKKNQADAAKMFNDRKKGLMEGNIDPSDENSQYYTKPDEPPIDHPAEVVERLKEEKPGLTMEEYVKLADEEIARQEKEVQAKRKADEEKALVKIEE